MEYILHGNWDENGDCPPKTKGQRRVGTKKMLGTNSLDASVNRIIIYPTMI